MRIRRAIATMAVGTTLVLGISVAPALAASSHAITESTVGSYRSAQGEEGASIAASTWHYWNTYDNIGECSAAGIKVLENDDTGRYKGAKCTAYGPYKFKLWILI